MLWKNSYFWILACFPDAADFLGTFMIDPSILILLFESKGIISLKLIFPGWKQYNYKLCFFSFFNFGKASVIFKAIFPSVLPNAISALLPGILNALEGKTNSLCRLIQVSTC